MKKISKILMLLLVAMLAMAIGVTALATEEKTAEKAGTHSISVSASDTHSYNIYQILVGDLSTDKATLSNVSWGSSAKDQTDGKINGKTATEFAKSLESLSGVDAVTEVMKYVNTEKPVGAVTKDAKTKDGLATGYYVMVDTTGPVNNTVEKITEGKALNVLQLVDDVTIEKKWGTTEDKKTIAADTLGKDNTEENTIEKDNDNVSIGDTVKYQIEATVPENANKFKPGTFFFVITDKLSSGLTFTTGSIEVYAGETKLTENTNYSIQYGINGNTFEVGLVDADTYHGQTITVTYKAVLNENAVIGNAGNPNTSTVKYSTDPNKTYSGEPEDENHPGFPDSTKDVPTGETPESETITYSTGIQIQKVDENGDPLKGATFEISGQSAKKVVTKTEDFVVDAEGTYYALKNGSYTTTTPTENTMKKAADGATKGYVEDSAATGEGVIEVGGKTYRPYKPAEDATKTIYVLAEGSSDLYKDTTTKYKKTVNQKTVDSTPTDHKMSEAVDDKGLVRFDGLGEGEYIITETVTPDGYNTVAPVTLNVTYNENGTAKFSVTGGATYDETEGIIKITIENKKGGTLPETGGIGTTIFYIGGSILVLAALILLVTRRRMGAND